MMTFKKGKKTMDAKLLDKIIDIYYTVFNTSIVDTNKLTIECPENTEHFNSLYDMTDYMLEDIYLCIENMIENM